MPRCGRIRTFIREYKESPKTEKLSFIPPFLILIVEAVLLIHALTIDVPDIMVVELTTILLIISLFEIILVSYEIHERYQKDSYDRILTIRLDDFILEKRGKNVKKIVNDFIEKYPEYSGQRGEIYHTTCQILETHEQEDWDKKLGVKLESFIKKRKDQSVDKILEDFIIKYPPYKRDRSIIYEKICHILGRNE